MYALPVGIVFLCLATVTVALRLYTRLKLVRKPGWDDLLIVLSLATDVVFFAFLVIEIQNGLAENEADLAPEVVRRQLKALWITIPLYNLTLTLTKLSLIFLYRRLFPTHTYRILLILTLIFVIITGLWMVLSTLIFCIPINAFWDTSIPHTCLPEDVVWCLNAAFQITTDLILVVLPLPILANLNLPKRQESRAVGYFCIRVFCLRNKHRPSINHRPSPPRPRLHLRKRPRRNLVLRRIQRRHNLRMSTPSAPAPRAHLPQTNPITNAVLPERQRLQIKQQSQQQQSSRSSRRPTTTNDK
ncbi:hypothetical protein CBS147343_956 [Aspergillus niger]|nr:hypothetical protein CBS147321_2814 [Aspergillus niger]KAI2980061.1 hypothetical protein CBS147324_147 [Aspergillus niger]KAI2992926.1 hypothetical protein CBS147344_336 [Aspergillus niger]KAI3014924.1 hypothetical protein CBS147482_3560 [Aspergillus niger]KAI3058158.1 hypothetical protein CBS147352_1487 [Aspergillus niger]